MTGRYDVVRQYGIAPPSRTRHPWLRATRASSCSRRDLPTPASPITPTSLSWPGRACGRAARNTSNSCCRPTNSVSPRAFSAASNRLRTGSAPTSWNASAPAGLTPLSEGLRHTNADQPRSTVIWSCRGWPVPLGGQVGGSPTPV